jgi:hypothetical protein
VKRWVAVGVVALTASGALIAFGPARLRPWECHDLKYAGTPKDTVAAYYAACWNRPTVSSEPADEGAAPAGTVGDGRAWHHLVEFSVQYHSGDTRFLLVGQRQPGDSWRPVEGEGTGP